MTHAHITTWLVALILFFVAIGLQKSGKAKGLKIVHMILRLFYVLIVITGAMMLFSININLQYAIKSILGIVVIGFLEMVLVRATKGKSTGLFWVLLIVSFAIVVYLGLQLPMGF